MASVVVDTNVADVANGDADHADSKCMLRCLQELKRTQNENHVLLDSTGLILTEYLKRKPYGFPQGPGDAFIVWVNDNLGNNAHIRIVTVTPLDDDPRGFAEFPDDYGLVRFDRDDRKFVAVALASGENPPVLNATDTDWWTHRDALLRNGVRVEFLCQHLMRDRN